MYILSLRQRTLAIIIFATILASYFLDTWAKPSPFQRCNPKLQDNQNECYTQYVIKTLKTSGLTAALKTVSTIADQDVEFSQSCHTTMHEIGKLAYETYKKSGTIEISDKLSYCNFGFYHSFIEAMIVDTGGVEKAEDFCNQTGSNVTDSLTVSNCYHGIGHGISSEPEVLGSAYEMSLAGLNICKKIKKENGYQRSCQLGVFNSIALLYENHEYKLKTPENAFDLCTTNNYSDEERSSCFLQMATMSIKILNDDLKKQFALALSINPKYQEEIFYDLATYSIQGSEPQVVIATCRSIGQKYVAKCVQGVAAGLKVFGYIGDEYRRALDFYKEGDLSPQEKELFLTYLMRVDVNNESEQKVVCNKFPKDLRIGPCKLSS